MILIKNNNNVYETYFNGISIINCTNTLFTYKKLFLGSDIYVDDIKIKNEDIVYIDELSKISNFIDLNKKSFLIEMINQQLGEKPIINYDAVRNIIDNINDTLGLELLTDSCGDINKIVQLLFELIDDKYLNISILHIIFQHCLRTKKLIILNNISWLKISELYKYLNEHYFIILTNDIRYYINKMEMLNIVTNYNIERNELNSIYDVDKFLSYIEKNISEPFDNKMFYDFIEDKNSLKSLRILNFINNL